MNNPSLAVKLWWVTREEYRVYIVIYISKNVIKNESANDADGQPKWTHCWRLFFCIQTTRKDSLFLPLPLISSPLKHSSFSSLLQPLFASSVFLQRNNLVIRVRFESFLDLFFFPQYVNQVFIFLDFRLMGSWNFRCRWIKFVSWVVRSLGLLVVCFLIFDLFVIIIVIIRLTFSIAVLFLLLVYKKIYLFVCVCFFVSWNSELWKLKL